MRYVVFCLALALTGCAGMSENECRAANWYELGERDGLNAIPPRIDTYAFQCARHNAQASREPYMEGWWIGNATYRDRTAHDSGM